MSNFSSQNKISDFKVAFLGFQEKFAKTSKGQLQVLQLDVTKEAGKSVAQWLA